MLVVHAMKFHLANHAGKLPLVTFLLRFGLAALDCDVAMDASFAH